MDHARTTPISISQRWQYSVEVGGFDFATFQKITIPTIEFDEVEFSSAGSMFPQKAAGRVKFDDISLEAGVVNAGASAYAREWVAKCIDVTSQSGGHPSDYTEDLLIKQLDRKGEKFRSWNVIGAWIKKLEYGDFEGGSSDNVIEVMTLSYQYYAPIK